MSNTSHRRAALVLTTLSFMTLSLGCEGPSAKEKKTMSHHAEWACQALYITDHGTLPLDIDPTSHPLNKVFIPGEVQQGESLMKELWEAKYSDIFGYLILPEHPKAVTAGWLRAVNHKDTCKVTHTKQIDDKRMTLTLSRTSYIYEFNDDSDASPLMLIALTYELTRAKTADDAEKYAKQLVKGWFVQNETRVHDVTYDLVKHEDTWLLSVEASNKHIQDMAKASKMTTKKNKHTGNKTQKR